MMTLVKDHSIAEETRNRSQVNAERIIKELHIIREAYPEIALAVNGTVASDAEADAACCEACKASAECEFWVRSSGAEALTCATRDPDPE